MTTKELAPLKVLPVANTLGESVLYDDRTDSIWWTDIKGRELFCYSLGTDNLLRWQPPAGIASLGLTTVPGWLIVAFIDSIALYHPERSEVLTLAQPERDLPGNRFNDGRVDRQGRFWVGSMAENTALNPPQSSASLYRVDPNGKITQALDGLQISNGLSWSPCSQWLYHADSPTGEITRFAFDHANGHINTGQAWAQTPQGCSPDGATVDAQGGLWSAHWGGHCVVRYTPQGLEDFRITLPVSQPTCVALGGHEASLLFVTSAKDGLTDKQKQAQPQAGHLFIFRVGKTGLPEPRYQAENLLFS
jgi:L-arabinonolactonase